MKFLNKFVPDIKSLDVFEIDYQKLLEQNIGLIVFDLDNTLTIFDTGMPEEKTIKLLEQLQKQFDLIIVSNNNYHRVEKYIENLNLSIKFIASARKPFKKVYKNLSNMNKNVAFVGDQLVTDIFGANRNAHLFESTISILVNPVVYQDGIMTKINRIIEKLIKKQLKNKGIEV